MTQNFKEKHLAQHIESLGVDTSNYTEYNYRRMSSPIAWLPSTFDLLIKHNLYLYGFEYEVEERFDSPRLSFYFCGDTENMTAYSKETNTENPTKEEIEQAILRDKTDPYLAELFND